MNPDDFKLIKTAAGGYLWNEEFGYVAYSASDYTVVADVYERLACPKKILCAATVLLDADPMKCLVIPSHRHSDPIYLKIMKRLQLHGVETPHLHGFIDTFGAFHNRIVAKRIVLANDQPVINHPGYSPARPELFSEDLYCQYLPSQLNYISRKPATTGKFAGMFWEALKNTPGEVLINLSGEIGAGKTYFCRELLAAAGEPGGVSPSYAWFHQYQVAGRKINHVDLYRLPAGEDLRPELSEELAEIMTEPASITLIEWAEKKPNLPIPELQIVITAGTAELTREFTVRARQPQGQEILKIVQEQINCRKNSPKSGNSLV